MEEFSYKQPLRFRFEALNLWSHFVPVDSQGVSLGRIYAPLRLTIQPRTKDHRTHCILAIAKTLN